MPITQYTGKTLLAQETLGRIQKETEGLLADKDVAGAYSASQHIKQELSLLPKEEVAPFLPAYRGITARLKALALPVLAEEDVRGLLANNLEFLDTRTEPLVAAGLSAWLASQPDEAQAELKARLGSALDQGSPFAPKLAALLKDASAPLAAPTLPGGGDAGRTHRDDDEILAPSEQDDVARSAKKASAVSARAPLDAGIDSIARGLFSLSGSSGSEEAFVKRARALVNSRLRDIRTAAEFADYAQRPFAAGGLGLSGDALERAERMMEEAYNRGHGIRTGEPQAPGAALTPKAAPTLPAAETPSKIKASRPPFEPVPSIPEGSTPPAPPTLSAPPKPPLPVQAPQAAPAVFQSAPRRAIPGTKPRLDDVVARASAPTQSSRPLPGRAMGLSDELGTITLGDFRAFGGSGAARNTILGKIETLAGESIGEKVAGIRSLRQSPLFAAYLAIGNAALAGGKKLSDALSDPAANPEGMTEDEFFTIADLASKLK